MPKYAPTSYIELSMQKEEIAWDEYKDKYRQLKSKLKGEGRQEELDLLEDLFDLALDLKYWSCAYDWLQERNNTFLGKCVNYKSK